jgi:hypothetical protein
MRKIGIRIENGKLELRTEGFQGEACISEAETLIKKLKTLGVEVDTTEIEKTREFFTTQEQRTKVKA